MILGSPQILGTLRVGGSLACPWSPLQQPNSRSSYSTCKENTIPGSLKPDSRDPETETGNLETEKRVHRILGTLETGLHKDAPQPGGPLKGGRRIKSKMKNVHKKTHCKLGTPDFPTF